MRKLGIAAVIVSLATAGAAASASGGATKGSHAHGSGKGFTVFSKTVQLKLLDLGDANFSLGDQAVFSDDLLTQKNGAGVGFDGGVCTVVRVDDAAKQNGSLQCLVTFSLQGGQITSQGLNTVTNGAFTGTQVAAITGGTGRYRGARGEVAVEFLGPGEANVTFSIRG